MGIHKIDKDRELGKEGFTDSAGEIVTEIGYTDGKSEEGENVKIPLDKQECYAKMMTISGKSGLRYKHYVKVGISGNMFNPWGLFSEGTQSRYAKHAGKSAWVFREVNAKSFRYYMTFLRTRNSAWLNNAEREVRDG